VELDYETELAKAEPVPASTLNRLSDPTHVLHTSGTTGVPKGALVTLQTITWNTLNVMHDSLLTGPGTKQLNPLPLFHAGGLTTYANPILLTGGAQSVMRRFDPVATARQLTDPSKGITHWIAPPVMHQAVAATREFQEGELSTLVFALVAGGVPPQALVDQWLAKGVALQQSYGGTELGPAITLLTRDQVATRSQSCGRAVPFTHVRLVTPGGAEAQVGEVGEVWIKGPSVTPGYWRVPEGDSDGFEDGWFRTGDAAKQDDEGYYYLVDRFKDMYKSGGENVYPAEVERHLITHPAVAEVAILGVPDERWGQVGHAFVVVNAGATVTIEDLVTHCHTHLARYKAPKLLSIVEALPRNTTGKVQKQLLREALGVSGIG
jgi:fatty-acyl-CoA synthase